MSSKPNFRDLPEEAIQEWRNLAPSALLAESLRREADEYLRDCSTLAKQGSGSLAAWASGYAAACEVIANDIAIKREPKEAGTQDSTFVDPASRRSRREVTS